MPIVFTGSNPNDLAANEVPRDDFFFYTGGWVVATQNMNVQRFRESNIIRRYATIAMCTRFAPHVPPTPGDYEFTGHLAEALGLALERGGAEERDIKLVDSNLRTETVELFQNHYAISCLWVDEGVVTRQADSLSIQLVRRLNEQTLDFSTNFCR